MKKANALLVVVFLLLGTFAWAQVTSDFSLLVNPTLNIPLGPDEGGTSFYSIGGGLSLKGEYNFPFFPYMYGGVALDVDFNPILNAGKALITLAGGPEIGFRYSPFPRFNLKAFGYGGMYFGTAVGGSVFNPFVAGGADLSFLLSPSMNIGIGATYKYQFLPDEYLYQGIGINVGVSYNIGASKRKAEIQITPQIQQIFPLFFTYYDKNPAGSLILTNNEREKIEDLKVSFYVKQFMDQPKLSAEIEQLQRGEELEIPIYALFNDQIFSVTEGLKVAGEIQLDYKFLGIERTDSVPVTVTINNRNAMTWDDDRKAAAFVTAKDELVLGFAKQVASLVSNEGSTAINGNFRSALALFEFLSRYGIGYVVDPVTPYAELSENKEAIDFIQFPAQTLAFKAGDCDDISILYSAMLEAIGVRTAFITAPGHIYMAFALGMDPEVARQTFLKPDDLIFREGDTWVPVEITLVKDGFIKAWQIGAKEWRETSHNGTAKFFPIRDAWTIYEPVAFSEYRPAIIPPSEAEIRSSGGSLRLVNNLGVLYAKYGLLEDAADQFERILRSGEYPAALVNLGNIHYLKGDMRRSLQYYQRALDRSPDNSVALLGVAKASYELEEYASVDNALAKLEDIDPEKAKQFSFLGSGASDTARASQAAVKEVSSWDEE
jgi:tetratricopeptide (TPR) repeat protein